MVPRSVLDLVTVASGDLTIAASGLATGRLIITADKGACSELPGVVAELHRRPASGAAQPLLHR